MSNATIKVLGYIGMLGLASLPCILWYIFFGDIEVDEEYEDDF